VSHLGSIFSGAVRLKNPTTLSPILWLSTVGVACLIGAERFWPSPRAIALVIAGVAPILTGCFIFIWFAISKPEKLQSERYQILHEMLGIIEKKGDRVEMLPVSMETLAKSLRTDEPLDEEKQSRRSRLSA
jgi:hypothetical protein